DLDAPAIAGFAAQAAGVVGQGPQLVVARSPEDAPEPLGRDLEREPQVLLRLTEIPAQDQPVVGMVAQRGPQAAVRVEADVEIAHRDQLRRRAGGCASRRDNEPRNAVRALWMKKCPPGKVSRSNAALVWACQASSSSRRALSSLCPPSAVIGQASGGS